MAEAAPLLSIPQAPAPLGGAAEWVTGEGGVRLRAALFPAAEPRGSVVLSPGRSESIEKYYEVIDELRGRGFTVLCHDWRGQGLSQRLTRDALRGHGSGPRAYAGDLRRLLDAFETRLPRPWIGLSHSMGAGLTLFAMAEGEDRFAALVLTSAMLAIDLTGKPAALARPLAWLFSRTGGGWAYAAARRDPLDDRFEDTILTHDHPRWARTQALIQAHPELRLGSVTWSWLALAFDLAARLSHVALDLPIAMVSAGEERLVDNAAARAFAARSRQATYVEITGAYHEILIETDSVRARFWAVFDQVAEGI